MKNRLTFFLGLFSLLFAIQQGFTQTVIGGITPDGSAMLDVQSNSKGVLLPRMTTTERGNITTPATGLMIFNTTTECLEINLGTPSNPGWQGITCPPPPIPPAPPALGSTFTTYSNNGIPSVEMFSTNTTCQNQLISAGYAASNCPATVTVGSNTYNTVLINGQCWMKTNLKEVPSTIPTAPTWVNYSQVGWWGYYNDVVSEPAPGEGILYQWSAAMNGSTTARAQGVCPSGWHIPSDCEWMYLEHGQGMSILQQSANTNRSSGDVGAKLSTLTDNGNNSTGFTGLLAGSRDRSNGAFIETGTRGNF